MHSKKKEKKRKGIGICVLLLIIDQVGDVLSLKFWLADVALLIHTQSNDFDPNQLNPMVIVNKNDVLNIKFFLL